MAKITSEKTITTIKLELSVEEAAALLTVSGSTGGATDSTPRKHTENVLFELKRLLTFDDYWNKLPLSKDIMHDRQNAIYFKDNTLSSDYFTTLVKMMNNGPVIHVSG